MKKSRLRPSPLAFRTVAVALSLATCGAQGATVTRTVLDDGSTVSLYNPAAAVGPDGTVHIAAQGRDATDPNNGSLTEIYYLSHSASGTVRSATRVNVADGVNEGRPKIAVTSTGKVVITWAGNSEPMKAVLLDPAAPPASLIEVAETEVGASTDGGHHALAIDGNDKAHVIRTTSTNLLHVRFDAASLTPDVAEHAVGTAASSSQRIDPGFGIDANNRLHVVYGAGDVDAQDPAAYTMLNDDGTVRIASTPLFARDDGLGGSLYAHAAHLSLMVESPSLVHVVYGDKRDTTAFNNWPDSHTGGTAFYVKLNPAADDQDGDAADIMAMRVGSEVTIGGYWYGQAYRDGGTVHFVAPAATNSTGDLLHRAITTSSVSMSDPAVYTAQIAGHGKGKHYVRIAGDSVVWAESMFSPTLSGITTRLVRAALSSVADRPQPVIQIIEEDDGCSLGTGRSTFDPTLWILAALAGLFVLRRRAIAAKH